MSKSKTIKSALESMMFVWGEPLDVKIAAQVCNVDREEALECFLELQMEYEQEDRGLRIRRINNSFQFITYIDNEIFIKKLCTPIKYKKLSQSSLEVLAIIAYKQPVSKSEIDGIRGVKCDRSVENLLKKELIEEKGRSDSIGRPILYGTTDIFLKQFGFSNIKELPDIKDIESAIGGEENIIYKQLEIETDIVLKDKD